MRKIEPYILILMIFACGLVLDPTGRTYYQRRYLIWSALVIVLFIMISYRAMRGEVDNSIIKRAVFPLFGVYLLLSIISLIFAANVSEGLYVILKTALFAATVYVVAVSDKRYLIKSMVLLAIIIGAVGVWQYFTIEMVAFRGGLMGAKNQQSSALLLLLPFCVYSLWKTPSKTWKVVCVISIAIILFNIFTLRSRAVWLALIMSILVHSYMKKRLILTVLALTMLFFCVYYISSDYNQKKITNTMSLNERFTMWSASLDMLKDHPLGVGAGNWIIYFQKYGSEILPETDGIESKKVYFSRLHNDYLQILCEIGLIGLLFYLGTFVCSIYYGRRNLMIVSVIVIYMAVAFWSYPGERAFQPLILAVAMGFALAEYHEYHKFHPKSYLLKGRQVKPQVIYLASIAVLSVLTLATVDFWHRMDRVHMMQRIKPLRATARLGDAAVALSGYPSWFAQLDYLGGPIIANKADYPYAIGD
ncbi:O-antigen ligase family protein, partial [Candidatus Pacearchaeota archaeon]|nr:O-antigen ligase family protein [Candidatus Pacearchaeota archaeon]